MNNNDMSTSGCNTRCARYNKNLVEFLLFLVVFLICLFANLLYSVYGVTDPFLSQHIAYIIKNFSNPHIPLFSENLKYIPAFGVFVVITSKITAISPVSIQFLPVLGPIFIIVAYTLSRKALGLFMFASIATILIFYGFTTPYYSVWPHGFGFLLYLMIVLLHIIYGQKKDSRIVLLFFILFVSVNFYSYTATVWSISLTLFLMLLLIFFKKEMRNIYTRLVVFQLVVFLFYNKIIYGALFTIESYGLIKNFGDTIITFFIQYMSKFLPILSKFATSMREQYIYVPQTNPLVSWLYALYLFGLLLPVILSIVVYMKKRDTKENISFNLILWFSAMLVVFIDIISYSLFGAVFLRYIFLIYPIPTILALRYILDDKKAFYYSFILAILILSVFSLNWLSGVHITSTSHYSELAPSASWFFNHSDRLSAVIDQVTGSRYEVLASLRQLNFDQIPYTLSIYRHLVDPSYISTKTHYFKDTYIIINNINADKKTWSGGWRDFEPLGRYFRNINVNINILKIYDGQYISIFRGY